MSLKFLTNISCFNETWVCALHFVEIFYFVKILSKNKQMMKLEFILIQKQVTYERSHPTIKYMLKITDRNTKTRCVKYVQN